MTSALPSRTPSVSVPPHSQESRAQANADLSARMLRGVYSYPLMMSVLAVATDSFQQHPRLMWSTTLVLAGALLARLGLIIGRHYLYASRPVLWRGLLALTVIIIGVCCGGLHATSSTRFTFWRKRKNVETDLNS